jgi:hypothetical protein
MPIHLCKYKDSLGKPNTGLHSIRFMGVAIFDVLLTLVGAIAIAWLFGWPYIPTIIGFYILGIVAHRAFCVRTAVDKALFPKSIRE